MKLHLNVCSLILIATKGFKKIGVVFLGDLLEKGFFETDALSMITKITCTPCMISRLTGSTVYKRWKRFISKT